MTLKYNLKEQTMSLLVGRPEVIDGSAALLQRVEKLLRTPAGAAEIYARSGYGLDLYNHIKQTRNPIVLTADLTKELTEKVVNGVDVFGVRDVKVTVTGHTANVYFVLETIYGSEEIEVRI